MSFDKKHSTLRILTNSSQWRRSEDSDPCYTGSLTPLFEGPMILRASHDTGRFIG